MSNNAPLAFVIVELVTDPLPLATGEGSAIHRDHRLELHRHGLDVVGECDDLGELLAHDAPLALLAAKDVVVVGDARHQLVKVKRGIDPLADLEHQGEELGQFQRSCRRFGK